MELIDKAAVVAEIERRKRKLLDNIICESDKEWVVRTAHQLNRILLFLDTLEVIEIGVDIGSPDGDIGVKTIWHGDKIVSNKARKGE